MGRQAAARVLLAADWVTAARPSSSGSPSRSPPTTECSTTRIALARRIAGFPPAAVETIKRLLRAPHAAAIHDARAREDEAFRRAFGRPEGLAEGTAPSVH